MIDRFNHLFITPSDFEASLAFYRDVLGWTVTEEWGGTVSGRGVTLSGGGIRVVLAERNEGDVPVDGPRPNVHLDIHDIDARYQALPKGDHVVVPPQGTQWGTRWFVVRDPDGNVIAFEELHGKGT